MDIATDPLFSIITYIWVKKIIENGFWDMSVSLKSGGIWMWVSRKRSDTFIRRSSYGILDIKKTYTNIYTNYICHNKIYNMHLENRVNFDFFFSLYTLFQSRIIENHDVNVKNIFMPYSSI